MSEITDIEKIRAYCESHEYNGSKTERFGVWYTDAKASQLASQFGFRSFHTCHYTKEGKLVNMYLAGKVIEPDNTGSQGVK